MATSTTRLALRKPDPDPVTGNNVNVATDVNDNMDKLDGVIGFTVCTSGTRPGSPFQGQPIFETDTGFAYVCVSTGPAVWRRVSVENSSGDLTLTGNVKAAAGAQTRKGFLSASTTLANSTTETMIAQLTIAANEAVVGSVWNLRAWGSLGVTGTPTITLRNRLGGVGGQSNATTGAQTLQSGITGRLWFAETILVCLSTGVSASWGSMLHARLTGILAGGAPFVNDGAEITSAMDGTADMTQNSTVSNTFGISATWSAASASNTITCKGFAAERLA
jgi:hypothetical protein